MAQPRRQFWRIAACLVILVTAGPGLARAQIRHNDFTEMSSTFSTNQASSVLISPGQMGISGPSMFVGTLPNLDSSVNDKRATLTGNSFQKTFSTLNGQMAGSQWKSNFPLGPNLPLKMAPSSPMHQPQMADSMQKNSPLNDFASRDQLDQHEVGPSKFTDAYTFHAVDNGTQLAEVGHELSLQDINRYQFQGSFSSAPGLPVTHAGGATDLPSVSGGSLSNITSGDSLFDSGSMPTSHPRSGAAVAPNFITTGGTIPYNPTRGTSPSSSVPLGASSNGGPAPNDSTDGFSVPLQHSASAQSSNKPQNIMPTGGLIPSGTYEPTSPSGKELPIQVDQGEVIVRGATPAPQQ